MSIKKMSNYSLKKNYYKGFLTSIYFNKTINSIIRLGNLKETKKKILDFGCGYGVLKKKLGNSKVYNYDIDRRFSDYKSWKHLKFDYFIANQVFYLFSEKKLQKLLNDLYKKNSKVTLIVGISYQNILSKLLKKVLNFKNAHKYTKLSYDKQVRIINKNCIKLAEIDNFYANKVIKLKFKKKLNVNS